MRIRLPGWRRVDLKLLWEVLRRFRFLLAGQTRSIVMTVVLTLVVTAAELLRPWPIKITLDEVVIPLTRGEGPLNVKVLFFAAGSLLGLSLLIAASQYARSVMVANVGRRAATRLRRYLFQHLQRLPFAYHLSQRTGDLLVRLTGDVNMVRDLVFASWVGILSQLVTIVAVLSILFAWSVWLALASVLPIPILLWFMGRTSKRLKAVTKKQRRKEGEAASFAAEALAEVRLIKSYACEDSMSRAFGREARSTERAGAKAAAIAASMAGIGEVLTGLGLASVLLLGAFAVESSSLTAGTLVVVVSYVRMLYKPIRGMTKEGVRVARATSCAARILDVLNQAPEDGSTGRTAQVNQGGISFHKVTYLWPEGGRGVQDLTFNIPAKALTLIQGPNGSGKSTTFALLMRLVSPEPDGGQILLDGVDISTFALDSYRRLFSYVPQHVHLLKGTIRENLCFGDLDASDAQLLKACELAHFDTVLTRFKKGLDTPIGERGESLSGGEARRLMLARAAVRDAPFLLLDEPLEGLDPSARLEVARGIAALSEGRTTIAISHGMQDELSPAHIIVLREGVVVGSPKLGVRLP